MRFAVPVVVGLCYVFMCIFAYLSRNSSGGVSALGWLTTRSGSLPLHARSASRGRIFVPRAFRVCNTRVCPTYVVTGARDSLTRLSCMLLMRWYFIEIHGERMFMPIVILSICKDHSNPIYIEKIVFENIRNSVSSLVLYTICVRFQFGRLQNGNKLNISLRILSLGYMRSKFHKSAINVVKFGICDLLSEI